MAKELRLNFRAEDYVCRVGGDEFVVILTNMSPDMKLLIKAKVLRINANLQETEDGIPAVTSSTGVSFGKRGMDVEILFKKADNALYRAKNEGRNTVCFEE